MSLSDRRTLLLMLAALPLAACGFTPAFGPNGAGTALRGQVRVDDPKSNLDFDFVAAFEDRLGRVSEARYALGFTLTITERGSAQVAGFGETRIAVVGNVIYTLTELATGQVVASDSVQNFTNYSTTSTQLATLRAREDAERRLARILADQVAVRLIAALSV
jgi:LPS-assembly lipoprotein